MEQNIKNIDSWVIVSFESNDTHNVAGLRVSKLRNFLEKKNLSVKLIHEFSRNPKDISVPLFTREKTIRRILNFLLIPDLTRIWVRKVILILNSEKKNFILFTSSPRHGVHLIGLHSKHKHAFWIADFRDPWINNVLYKKWFHKHFFNKRLERNIFKNANLIIANSVTDEKEYKKIYPAFAKKVITMRNGFDENLIKNPQTTTKTDQFVYSGSTSQGAALQFVNSFLNDYNSLFSSNYICHYYGRDDFKNKNFNYIKKIKQLNQSEVPSTISKYRFGFAYLPEVSLKSGRILQKFYDYISVGVCPIIINPSKEICRIVEEINFGILYFPTSNNLNEIKKQMEKMANFSHESITDRLTECTREHQFKSLLKYLS